eukprot:SAG22_NODE_3369_length_1752_cov_2.134301_2_plen_71_part_00
MHEVAAVNTEVHQAAPKPMTDIPEVAPIRFDVSDVKGFKAHLDEHGCEQRIAPPFLIRLLVDCALNLAIL